VLCRKVGGGRVPAFEIMINTTSIAALIRDNKAFRIPSDIQTGASLGMITLDNHLTALVQRGQVRAEDAIDLAQDPQLMREKLLPGGGRPRTL